MSKATIEIEIDFGEFGDDDWIGESSYPYDVSVAKRVDGEVHEGKKYILRCIDDKDLNYPFQSIPQLYGFFSKQGIEPQDSLMTIGEFKEKFCK